MRSRKPVALVFGAALLANTATACSTDNHGSPVLEGLYQPVVGSEAYLKNIMKIEQSDHAELVGVEEGHIAAQFNQEGLQIAVVSPGKLELKFYLTLLDEDGNEVLGAFKRQPFSEPKYADRDKGEFEVSFQDIVDCIDKKVAQKVTDDKDVDIQDWINDGSIRINYEFAIEEKGITAPSGNRQSIDAPYFTGDRIELLSWPNLQALVVDEVETVYYTYRPVTTCTSTGKSTSCSTHLVADAHYRDEAEVHMDVVGDAQDQERSPENALKYFENSQKVEVLLRDRNDDSETSLNGRLTITTEQAEFQFYLDEVPENGIVKINCPTWAGAVRDAYFTGNAAVTRGGDTEQVGIELSISGD